MGKKLGTSKQGLVRYLIDKGVATAKRGKATKNCPDGPVRQVVFNFPQPKRGLTSVLPDPLVVTAGSEAAAEAAPVPAASATPEAAAAREAAQGASEEDSDDKQKVVDVDNADDDDENDDDWSDMEV